MFFINKEDFKVKKIAKIVAGLVLGLVIVAGVKTEAKASEYTDLLKALGYTTSSSSYSLTGYTPYDTAIKNYYNALEAYEAYGAIYAYMGALTDQYADSYYYLAEMAEYTQAYSSKYGVANPYTYAMKDLVNQYQEAMSYFYY